MPYVTDSYNVCIRYSVGSAERRYVRINRVGFQKDDLAMAPSKTTPDKF